MVSEDLKHRSPLICLRLDQPLLPHICCPVEVGIQNFPPLIRLRLEPPEHVNIPLFNSHLPPLMLLVLHLVLLIPLVLLIVLERLIL
jgi:hypothetical protein